MKGVSLLLKKKAFLFLLAILMMFLLFWLLSFAKCEYLTTLYGDQFEDLYREHTMIATPDYLKVLEYTDVSAKVYYVKKGVGGNVLSFERAASHEEWRFVEWITIWSKFGSASDFVWPYIR